MQATPFSSDNKAHSDAAHLAARLQIYPALFKTDAANIDYEDQGAIETPRWGALDGDMSIDRIVKVSVKGLRQPLIFTVQERFRRPDSAWRQDITVTEWNPRSNLPSELYKISANFFLYGYFDKDKDRFVDAICVNVPDLLLSIVSQSVKYDRKTNPRTQQPFLCFKFADLHEASMVIYRMRETQAKIIKPKVKDIDPVDAVKGWFRRVDPSKRLALVSYLLSSIADSKEQAG